jgi:glycosyltransferase involved in cell wall biosynthesis
MENLVKKLSIITINLNNDKGLEKTILSVINQTFKNFEFIVIDGKSNDRSLDIIHQYADQITFWVSEPDNGIYNAMNKGIFNAVGEYCLFLNSGDCLYSNDILNRVFFIDSHEDIIYGDVFQEKGGRITGKRYFPDHLTFRHFFIDTLPHQGSFIKRILFDTIGLYSEEFKIISDWEFFLIALIKNSCTYKKYPGFISIVNIEGISPQNIELDDKEREMVLEKHFPRFIKDYEMLLFYEKYYQIHSGSVIKKLKRYIRRLLKWAH